MASHGEQHEEGIAMITALLVMMICGVLVIASLALATHSSGQSAQQRNLTAALHAAEYGLQEEMAALAAPNGASICPPTTATAQLLPDAALPAQWYAVTSPTTPACNPAPSGTITKVIIATGYAIGAGSSPPLTPPTTAATRTIVAHVTLQPAGATSSGGYGFPDAVLALKGSGAQTGNITASTAYPLTVTGIGLYAPTVRADGAVSLSGGKLTLATGQTFNSLSSWGSVSLTSNPVTGNVASTGSVTLATGSNVTGNVIGSSVAQDSQSTVSGNVRTGTATLPAQPPVPTFTYNSGDWSTLTGGGSPTTSCPPASGSLSGFYSVSVSCTFTPTAVSGTVAVIATGNANLTVNLPSYTGGSQLYLIAAGGTVTITGGGTGLPVFVYGSAGVTVGGTIVGQLAGGSIATSAPTNLDAELVGAPPDFAFPTPVPSPAPTGYVPQISDEYLCAPKTTTAC
ncbi:MAG: hypothetical protein M3083_16345 [Actinomycetota bacterium]|nr:hypothetical protein [Actinomycetota bacterium]